MRTTIQSQAVLALLNERVHATNLDLYNQLKSSMPTLTLPSIHRITIRLASEGIIGVAPHLNGVSMLDSNPVLHDHFYCTSCAGLMNIDLADSVIQSIQNQLGQNIVRRGLLVSGTCENCQLDTL